MGKEDAFMNNSMATGKNTDIVDIHRGMRVAYYITLHFLRRTLTVSLLMRSRQQ